MNRALVLMFVGILLAGCVQGEGVKTIQESSTTSAPPVVATTTASTAVAGEETGAISVTVTTTELQPVSAAQVTIADTELSAFTDAAGLATFSEIDPGTYTVLAAKPGYNALQDKGRLAEVAAGTVTEIKLVLDPVQVVDAANSYHTTLPFRGFITCGIEGQPGIVLNRVAPCGDYLNPGGVAIGDPNHKARFVVPIDSIEIQGIVIDGIWEPATGVTAQQLRMLIAHQLTCGAASCIWNDSTLNAEGPPPVHASVVDGPNRVIVKRWGEDPNTYPRNVYAETGAYCRTNCTGVQVVFQQDFDKYVTIFYGAEPPAGFTALPPS